MGIPDSIEKVQNDAPTNILRFNSSGHSVTTLGNILHLKELIRHEFIHIYYTSIKDLIGLGLMLDPL